MMNGTKDSAQGERANGSWSRRRSLLEILALKGAKVDQIFTRKSLPHNLTCSL